MIKLLIKILSTVLLLVALLPSGSVSAQDSKEAYGWDCPGTGYLPFRRELLISTEELARAMAGGEVTVVHVGFDESKTSGIRRVKFGDAHLPDARHWAGSELSLPSIESSKDAVRALGLAPDRRIVLYDTGIGLEAAVAFVVLESLGFAGRVSLLDGQWTRWAAEGRPLTSRVADVEPTKPEFRPVAVTVSESELRDSDRARITWIGAGAEGRMGSIGTAARIFWTQSLFSVHDPILRGEEELRRPWAAAPPLEDRPVVVVGASWKESASVYFLARLLGYSVRILDASAEPEEQVVQPCP